MAKNFDRESILSDWKTGGYTIRDLAHKHGVSRGTIGPIVKGVDKNLLDKVDAKVAVDQAIRKLSDKDGQAVKEVSDRITSKLMKAEKIDDYLDNAIGIASKKAVGILNEDDATMQDVALFGKFQLDAKKGLGTMQENSKTNININNTNAQQNNAPRDFNDFYDA